MFVLLNAGNPKCPDHYPVSLCGTSLDLFMCLGIDPSTQYLRFSSGIRTTLYISIYVEIHMAELGREPATCRSQVQCLTSRPRKTTY